MKLSPSTFEFCICSYRVRSVHTTFIEVTNDVEDASTHDEVVRMRSHANATGSNAIFGQAPLAKDIKVLSKITVLIEDAELASDGGLVFFESKGGFDTGKRDDIVNVRDKNILSLGFSNAEIASEFNRPRAKIIGGVDGEILKLRIKVKRWIASVVYKEYLDAIRNIHLFIMKDLTTNNFMTVEDGDDDGEFQIVFSF